MTPDENPGAEGPGPDPEQLSQLAKRVAAYEASGGRSCLYCNSPDTETPSWTEDERIVRYDRHCRACGRRWVDVHLRTSGADDAPGEGGQP